VQLTQSTKVSGTDYCIRVDDQLVSEDGINCIPGKLHLLFNITCGPGGSVRLTMGWTVRGSNPGGGEIFRTCPDRPWGPPSLLYNGYQVFPGGKVRPGHDAGHSPLLVLRSWKSRAIPLPTLWATPGL
jgi:hypothetical protein